MAKFCINCGRQLAKTAKFCASCGAQQPQTQQPAQQSPPQPYIQPQYQPPYAPAPKPKSKTPLVVGVIFGALAIVLLFVLIATNAFGNSGGVNPNAPTPKPPTDAGSLASDLPSGNIDPKLVGVWGTGIDVLGDWYNYSTGAYDFTSSSMKGVEFKANGTFDIMTIVSGRYGTFQDFFKGNYSVEGDIIYFTNVLHKITSFDGDNILIANETYDWKSVADQKLYYEIFEFNDTHGLSFDFDDDLLITTGVIWFGSSNLFPIVD